MTQTMTRPSKSTIVRFFSAPLPVRATFRLLDRIAPRIGARWAERIWFTLPRPSPPAHGNARDNDTDTGDGFTLTVDGIDIAGEVWGDGPTVYLMHGWAGYHGQLESLVAPLVGRGYRVVSFDAPSHGASGPGNFGPRSSSIPEFAHALEVVVATYGPAHSVVAHSMGATATAVAVCDGLRVGRVVMLAPMASPESYSRQFARVFGFGARTHRHLLNRVERRAGAPMRHFDVPELGRAVAMPPTLIIHDRDDTTTPVTDGAAIAAAWTGAKLHVTSGLGHRRLLRDVDVVAEAVAFIDA